MSSLSSVSVASPVAAAAPSSFSSQSAASSDLGAASFAGVSEADQLSAIRRLYEVINPDKMGQVELMWQKFGAGIWEALSKRYTDVDMNEVCVLCLCSGGIPYWPFHVWGALICFTTMNRF